MKTQMESLERRTLFSSWTTVEDVQPSGSDYVAYLDIAADANGNVYAVGDHNGSGIVREKLNGSSTWTTILDFSALGANSDMDFNAVAVSPTGDLYVSGSWDYSKWTVLERPAGQTEFAVVDNLGSATSMDLAIDSNGDVYAVGDVRVPVTMTVKGKTTTKIEDRWTVRKRAAGVGAFTTVDQFIPAPDTFNLPNSITTVETGPGAGVYVVGTTQPRAGSPSWIVRKSADAGATWSTVDNMQSSAGALAQAVTSDPSGNLYVGGELSTRTITGGTKQRPIYTYASQWVMRKSTNGGTSWSQDASIPTGGISNQSFNMGSDAAGNVYAVSSRIGSDGRSHSMVRSNMGGSWQTVDDFQLAPGQETYGYGFAADPSGNLYAAGYGFDAAGLLHGFVRSMPAAPTPAAATFSFTSISTSDSGDDDALLDLAPDRLELLLVNC